MADQTLYDLSFTDNHGKQVDLSDFQGKPILIVNTASKCGFTPQYDGLQRLHEEFGPQGLVVLGFPCDQFAHQEPGNDAQIEEFCRVNHGVSFPLSEKTKVNGKDTHPVFVFLKERAKGKLGSRIPWNFTKFLVWPDGSTVRRYPPKANPESIVPEIKEALASKGS